MRFITALFTICLVSAPAHSATYATGDCTGQNGSKIRYALHQGEGMISYNGGKAHKMFSKREGNIGVITHIGDVGTMVLAVNFKTGRGYIVTKYDDGRQFEQNLSCKLGVVER